MPAPVQSLVEGAIQRVDAAPDKAGLTMRLSKRTLNVLRAATATRLGAPVLGVARRVIAMTDRAIERGTQTRAYTAGEKLAVKASFFLKAPRAKTRAHALALRRGVAKARASIARLPSELNTSVQVYVKAKKAQLAVFSRESRLRFKVHFERCNLLVQDKVRSSKILSFLSAKFANILKIAGVLPKETAATEKPLLVEVEKAKPMQRSAPPRTFTSVSAVTPTTMIHAVAGDAASISPLVLDSLRRSAGSSVNTSNPVIIATSNPSPTTGADFANPLATSPSASMDDENVHPPPPEEFFNAETRGGLWVPSPAKV